MLIFILAVAMSLSMMGSALVLLYKEATPR